MKQIATAFYFLVTILTSCKEKNSRNIESFENGNPKMITTKPIIPNHLKVEITFYENGEIKEIHRYNDKGMLDGEQMWFFPSGVLDRKIQIRNAVGNGNAYYFYDTSGTLSGHRYLRNDKEVFHGADYWEDSIGITKSSLYFNDSGIIYYKKNFDKLGHLINDETKK
jgi:antitoxin component YwqK of YwqJK toxin-antitoxin module